MTHPLIRRASRCIPVIGILWLGIAINAYSLLGPDNIMIADGQSPKANDDNKIKVDVEEVRLDVVVVDKKGHQITDLTTEDFKIYQDRKQQEITSCRYITYDQAKPEKQILPSPEFENIAPSSSTYLKKDAVRRSIVFLVNDYNFAFGDINDTRIALRKFVEELMQPGDLISILKTSRGTATLQAFTSNKRELLARIDTIQWKVSFMGEGGTLQNSDDEEIINEEPIYTDAPDFQEMAIRYCIQSLKDMPGQKYIMLLTDRVYIGNDNWGNTLWGQVPRYKELAEMALQAGVVVHLLSNVPVGKVQTNRAFIPFSQRTGGLFYVGWNFIFDGIRDANEMTKGYYLLSYIPPEKTFSKANNDKYHNIKVKVERKGATVHTRDGFYAVPKVAKKSIEALPPPPLVEIMFSPFNNNDLNINLISGYVDNLSEGYLLPTWMHLDGRDLRVIKEEDARHSVSFEVGASTTDIDGIFQDYGDIKIEFLVDEADIEKLRKNGINFTISIPVKKPGGYYVRAAARDRFSDAKGSAYQFIEIPDLKKKRLALSSLYIIDSEEDASWIRSIATDTSSTKPSEDSKRVTFRSPAHKEFQPGDSFEYMTVIYNAKTKKEDPPDLESQFVLYRDGVKLYKSEVEAIEPGGVSDFKRIPVQRKLHLEDSMQPGDYVLQFLVKDNNAKEKESLTDQTLSFRVTVK